MLLLLLLASQSNPTGACISTLPGGTPTTCRNVTKAECDNLKNTGAADVQYKAGVTCESEGYTNCQTITVEGVSNTFCIKP